MHRTDFGDKMLGTGSGNLHPTSSKTLVSKSSSTSQTIVAGSLLSLQNVDATSEKTDVTATGPDDHDTTVASTTSPTRSECTNNSGCQPFKSNYGNKCY